MNQHGDALARTTLLINRELFSGDADEGAIADALLSTTVRLEADSTTLACRAGQSALITGFVLTARLGIGIELVAPNVPVIDLVAPLQKPRLVDALIDLGSDLIPGARVRTTRGPVDERFVLGASDAAAPADVHVAVGDFTADLARGDEIGDSQGDLPYGGFAAGAAIAPIALEAAAPRMEEATGRSTRRLRPSPGPPVRIDLRDLFPELGAGRAFDLGRVDAISGGAITHALIFCLLRIPGLQVDLRVVEEQTAALSNVNRYMLLRASDEERMKIEQLEAAATSDVRIAGVPLLFTKETRDAIVPLAEHVVVGVDDVEARWWVQAEEPAWLAVGATGNHLAQLTTHTPDSPCAACAHPTPLPPQTIPTISFVSFWAGLLQACALVSVLEPIPRNVVVYPFALGGQAPMRTFTLVANSVCPNGCTASRVAKNGAA